MHSEQECREPLPQISLLVHIHTDMRVYEAKLSCQVQMFVGLYSSIHSVEAKLYPVFKGLLFKNTYVTICITVLRHNKGWFSGQ